MGNNIHMPLQLQCSAHSAKSQDSFLMMTHHAAQLAHHCPRSSPRAPNLRVRSWIDRKRTVLITDKGTRLFTAWRDEGGVLSS